MAYEENGVWKPWRHPDYRYPESSLQGWWRNQLDEIIAVLSETSSTAGNPAVKAAKYDFNADSAGSGLQMLVSTLERQYEQLPADFDPRTRSSEAQR